ncbi:bifunctional 2-polyprenyl-6-hydroxyphenol methylase/3-demethylubiquinol 3-O-methyltransferase UbiG [Agaribacterium haliotis]|uniref:bifunctional 2-polyprenyl-6-hydroxyphenol methylase/3-demethylubiquinol 3-O-methyltransferase UbiG n=1 Tax=Agaribacterium haliotis TaxID=2013869 RepID=UPI000BB536BB|nr:bifunctional 2-polyprenyl-6-hydroxyphenol methylase/3-demethylubiquinol 3-O-methyltransferase UbiG [Agaribacterium haliotis]
MSDSSAQNVDPQEIRKFERMASRWWDPEGEFKPLHQMNPVRANYVDAGSPVAGRRIIDIGCGGGLLSEALAQRGAKVCGLDMGGAPLEVARLHALESQLDINYQQCSAEDFAEQHAEQFDVLTCMEMLEHVPDPLSTIKACSALVKPGGYLYFSTINRNPKAYAFAILGAEYMLKLLPKGTHEYSKFIQPAELCCWLRQAGLCVEDISGISYRALSQSFYLNAEDSSVNYVLRARKETY